MKKKLIASMLVLVILLCAIGCGKKQSIILTFTNIESYYISKLPKEFKNCTQNDDTITMSVPKDGSYDFVVTTNDGQDYPFTLQYENGTVTITSEANLTYDYTIE